MTSYKNESVRKILASVVFSILPCFVVFSSAGSAEAIDPNPFPSTYKVRAHENLVFADVHILTASKSGSAQEIENGWVAIREGKVVGVGGGEIDADFRNYEVVEGAGHWLTPGIIDVHSHLGNYSAPGYKGHSDGNESTAPTTAQVWTEHSVWPQDPQFPLALEGGITSLQILPGSANLIGGRSVVLKNVSSRTVQGMKFPDAPYGLKMACGENPKRVYGNKGRSPATRMGNVAGYREAWIKATEYKEKWDKYELELAAFDKSAKNDTDASSESDEKRKAPVRPDRNLELDTLKEVLEGKIRIHNHCYRADEMVQMIDVGREFGYEITSFQHAVEAYKIADILAENNICSAMWADWSRFKLESFDGIEENIALVEKAGACAIVHSDSEVSIQRLNQEAAKAMAAGNRMGMNLSEADAIQWITINAAESLGIETRTGSIEVGKMADLVLWDGNPFSVYTRTTQVYVDGNLLFDRKSGRRPVTDFELGHRDWNRK